MVQAGSNLWQPSWDGGHSPNLSRGSGEIAHHPRLWGRPDHHGLLRLAYSGERWVELELLTM